MRSMSVLGLVLAIVVLFGFCAAESAQAQGSTGYSASAGSMGSAGGVAIATYGYTYAPGDYPLRGNGGSAGQTSYGSTGSGSTGYATQSYGSAGYALQSYGSSGSAVTVVAEEHHNPGFFARLRERLWAKRAARQPVTVVVVE